MTKTAIITGASSGIGKAICGTLLTMDYEIYGIGRDFRDCGKLIGNSAFHKVELDLLINCAGVGFYGLHDEISSADLSEMVRTNLEVPIVLTNLLLKKLRESKGTVINIASVTASQNNPHGAAYGATKAGLLSFSRSLFDEVRKHGVKVTTILPDMTDTNLYRNASFEASKDENARLLPQDVADAVRYVLEADPHKVITEFTVRPQLHRIEKKD